MSHAVSKPPRFIRCDPATAACPLFRALPKVHERPPLDVAYRSKNGGPSLRFSAREALGMPEQTVLLVLLELAQERYLHRPSELTVITPWSFGIGQHLWQALHEGHPGYSGETIYVRTSWHVLCGRCGSRGGRAQRLRKEQVRRLCEVTVWEEDVDALNSFRQSRLVSVWHGDDIGLHLAVNVRLARAVMGGHYVALSLRERLELNTDTAQALHAFLSAVIRLGRRWRFRPDTLMKRLWPKEDSAIPAGTVTSRRKAVRDALAQIGALDGWDVTWPKGDVASVSRRPAKVTGITKDGTSSQSQPRTPGVESPRDAAGDIAESFDVSRLLATVDDSPSPGTIDHDGMEFRQQQDAEKSSVSAGFRPF